MLFDPVRIRSAMQQSGIRTGSVPLHPALAAENLPAEVQAYLCLMIGSAAESFHETHTI